MDGLESPAADLLLQSAAQGSSAVSADLEDLIGVLIMERLHNSAWPVNLHQLYDGIRAD